MKQIGSSLTNQFIYQVILQSFSDIGRIAIGKIQRLLILLIQQLHLEPLVKVRRKFVLITVRLRPQSNYAEILIIFSKRQLGTEVIQNRNDSYRSGLMNILDDHFWTKNIPHLKSLLP